MIIGIDASRAFAYDRTGTENYSYHIISHMLRLPTSSMHHFVLFTRPGAAIPDWALVSHAEVVEIPYTYLWTQIGLAGATWKQYSPYLDDRTQNARLPHTRVAKPLDVLWIPAHTLPILRHPTLRTVVTIHGLEYRWLPEYNNLLQRWYLPLSTYYAARYADRIIAVSAYTKSQLVEIGTDPSKIDVIHEGVELAQSQTTDNSSTRTFTQSEELRDKKYILFVGTVQPRKNLGDLIAAFSRVKRDIPDIKLVIAGSRGWMTESLFRSVVALHLSDAVIFTGRVSDRDLATLYDHAIVAVQPSFQEGFGLPVLEAMAHRVPVVVSNGGALPEVAGDAGVVVPLGPGFVDHLAQALTRLITSPSLRRARVSAGAEWVRSFTWDRAASETLEVLTLSS